MPWHFSGRVKTKHVEGVCTGKGLESPHSPIAAKDNPAIESVWNEATEMLADEPCMRQSIKVTALCEAGGMTRGEARKSEGMRVWQAGTRAGEGAAPPEQASSEPLTVIKVAQEHAAGQLFQRDKTELLGAMKDWVGA